MAEELKPHHYWREDRITGRMVVITPDEYEQWGKDNQPSEAYRPAFARAQLPSQGGEAVAWRVTGRGGITVTSQYPEFAEADCLLTITPLYTAKPSPDAELVELIELVRAKIRSAGRCHPPRHRPRSSGYRGINARLI